MNAVEKFIKRVTREKVSELDDSLETLKSKFHQLQLEKSDHTLTEPDRIKSTEVIVKKAIQRLTKIRNEWMSNSRFL